MYVSQAQRGIWTEDTTHLGRRRVRGGKSSSGNSRFKWEGVWCLVGGVDPSDIPEELAVDGRTSGWSM